MDINPQPRAAPPKPMLATLGKSPTGPQWRFEAKFDGQRAAATAGPGQARLFSRGGSDITSTYPELIQSLVDTFSDNHTAVLDGEIVALDHRGRPSFRRLQQRMGIKRPSRELRSRVPATYIVFDVTEIDGRDVTSLPYLDRRAALDELSINSQRVKVSPYWGNLPGDVIRELMVEAGVEGSVSKLADSPYEPGIRSPAWVKTPIRLRSEFLIAGWLPGSGINRHTIGSLVLAAHDSTGALCYTGTVGTGFTASQRRSLAETLGTLARKTPPFDLHTPIALSHVRWVTPRLVGDVEYREFTGTLRYPAWKGLRFDVEPRTVSVPPTT